jgi:outer membrane protein TolC
MPGELPSGDGVRLRADGGCMRVFALLLLAMLVVGCSRAHYRIAADREVYPILGDRAAATGFAADRLHLEAAPTSRLADPTDPDKSPRPPDDPVAGRYMERPNGMKGARWRGPADWIEPPGWESQLPWGEGGKLQLDAEKSFELALLHSREYQTALEQLYVAALALTLNRFEFQTRWFLTNATDFSSIAPGTPGETNTLTSGSNLGFNRAFAAGGQLVVDFANNFVLEYTANGRTSVSSNFVVSFVQPLLRNAGRKVRLEQLTQAERDVLYAARDFYRFRKQFWAGITTLDTGYMQLLLQVQVIRNLQANLLGQEQNLREHEAILLGGKITTVQVDQVFQGYQSARAGVAQAEAGLQTSLDQYKILLGLPPHVPVELDDTPLTPFVLVDPKLEGQRDAVDAYQKARNRDIDAPPTLADLRKQYEEFVTLTDRVQPFVEAVARELDAWGKKLDPSKTDDTSMRVRASYTLFKETVPEMRTDLQKYRVAAKDEAGKLAEAKRKEGWEALVALTRKLLTLTDQLISVQAQIRINTIDLAPIDWKEADALTFAKANRLDLLTSQAQVTDAWRKVEVAANALKADLDLIANANLGTPLTGTNIANFVSDESRYSVGVRFDGPLNRQAERNAYRASLIAYQQARRSYMLLSDQVEQSVRNDLRQLELQRLNFEVARLNVISAARQLESSRQEVLRGQAGRDAGASTLNILRAQDSLLGARNAMISGYINYEQLRVQLLLDLEALRLDPHGYPIDERRSLPADHFAADRAPADPAGNFLPRSARLADPKK